MDSVGRALRAIFFFFSPPPKGCSIDEEKQWQYKVSTSLGCIVVFVISYAFGAAGMFPFVTRGFASAEDLHTQKDLWTELRRDQLDTKLFDTRGRQCAAIQNKNTQALESETRRLQDKLLEYSEVSDRPWRVPSCDEY
jgi:hypothetical protein